MKVFPAILSRSSVLALGGVLSLSLLTGAAQAAEASVPAVCYVGKEFSVSTAKLRDEGIARSELIGEIDAVMQPAKIKELLRNIVDSVYDAPNLTPDTVGRAFFDGCARPSKRLNGGV